MSRLQEDTSLKGRGDECFVLFLKCWCDTDEGWGLGGGRRIASLHTKLQNLFLFLLVRLLTNPLFQFIFSTNSFIICYVATFSSNDWCFLNISKTNKKLYIIFKNIIYNFLLGQVDCHYFAIKIGKGEMPFFQTFSIPKNEYRPK